jgi:hypothetical protein
MVLRKEKDRCRKWKMARDHKSTTNTTIPEDILKISSSLKIYEKYLLPGLHRGKIVRSSLWSTHLFLVLCCR